MRKRFYTLAELADMTHSKLVGDPDYLISNVADLQSAEAEDASFYANPHYEQAMKRSKAGVVFIASESDIIEGRNFLINKDPSRAFQQLLEAISQLSMKMTGFSGVHPSAVIHEKAIVGTNVTIGPNAVIDEDTRIGDNTSIGAGTYIGVGVHVGDDCHIHPNVTIRERACIGNNVTIQSGVVIGSCGFGYTLETEGCHKKLTQVGTVTIEDNVEIGANSTIDRSRFKSTHIGKGTKIDNLVQIGHGVKIGKNNVIVSQTGIAGSTETGDNVVMGGQVGVAGHIKITSNVAIGAKSGVSKSITKPGNYRGIPAVPIDEFSRNYVYLRKIDKYACRISNLEESVKALAKTTTES